MSSIWRDQFTETIQMRKKLSVNESTGDIYYHRSVDIKARVDMELKDITDGKGQHITTSMLIMTESPLRPGDRVTVEDVEWEVVWATSCKDVSGQLDHYEARI